jgi:hypothetical protein
MVSFHLPSGRVAPSVRVRCKPEGVGRDRANGNLAFPSGRIAPGTCYPLVINRASRARRSRPGPGRVVSSPPLRTVSHGDDEQLASLSVQTKFKVQCE